MKILIIFILSISVLNAKVNDYSLAVKAFKKNKNFIAAEYLKDYIQKSERISKNSEVLMTKIIERVNIYPFLELPFSLFLKETYSSNISYLLAKKNLFKKNDIRALNWFKSINKRSEFYLSSLLHTASIYAILNNQKELERTVQKCLKSKRSKVKSPIKGFKVKYQDYITDSCSLLLARNAYKNSKMKRALKLYDKVALSSATYPQSLFDSSWSYFRNNEYSRSLGKSITFQAPILNDYFYAETELVTTLNYVKVCQYNEALEIIKNFQQNIKVKALDFIKEFKLREGNNYSFLKFIYSKKLRRKFKDNFIIRLLEVLDVKPGMILLKKYFKLLKKEKNGLQGTQKKYYNRAYKNFSSFFNKYVRLKFARYSNEIIRVSNIMSEIELDLLSQIKQELYDEKKNKKKKRGIKFSYESFEQKSNQHYWDFDKEFWADELGDYIPLLKNKCRRKK